MNALRQVSEGQVQQKATQEVNQLVDSLDESAAKDTQEAKRGLGKTGSAIVDIGTAGLQLAADRAVGTAMGIGTMPVVAMRVFGGGTKEARQSGATLGQQLTYGAGSAAVSAATEQLSNVVKPFAKAFGAGVTDDVVEGAIGKAVERFARTPAGKTALEGVLKSGAGFLGEGLEEFAEDVASPILKRMTYDPSAQFDLQEALYDFLIGGALGGLGGAVEGVTDASSRYRGYQTQAAEAAVDSAYDTMREKGMFSQEARRAVRDAGDIMPKLDPGGDIAWGRMMEAVAPERQEQFQQAREIADRFGTDLVVDKLGNGAAGEYRSNVITIDQNTQNPVRQVLVHELTHHMESSGLYGDFSQKVLGFVAEDMNVDVEALKESIIQEYGRYGVELDTDGATRELVAKFAEEKLFRDEASIQRLLRTDRNLFQRIYDWIRDTIAKVRGTSEERFLTDAQRLYEKALRQAGSQQGAGAAQNTFAGVNARTADLNALSTAQELERQGMDADAIRRQTGWFRGMDGKWRFEIDDSGMRYERQGFTENPDMLRRRELENKMLYGDMTQAEMDELRSLTAATRGVPEPSKLGDFIRHDALFAAYPELKNVNVRFEDLTDGERGNYDRRTNTITLDQKMKNAPQDTIIHEVQHAIQQAENFAKGSNLEYWAREMQNNERGRYEDPRITRAEKKYRELFDKAPEELKNKVREINRAKINQDWDEVLRLETAIYEGPYADLYSELDNADWTFRDARERFKGTDPYDLYRNTAGEIEARDAAERRQMTPEQRELKMPTLGDENTVFADEAGSSAEYVGKTIDGTEVYETSEEVQKMPYKQRMETFMDIMRNEYAGRTAKFTANGDVYYAKFDEADLRKNVYGDKKSSPRGWKAKINTGADGNIFELVENAKYSRSGVEQGKSTAAHQGLTGWEYFVKTVQIDGRVYDLLANVRKKPDGEYVYSIQLNENKNKAPAPPRQYQNGTAKAENRPVRVPTDASGVSIPADNEFVNDDIMPKLDDGQFSMGRTFSQLVQNQRDGLDPTGEPDIMPKLTGIQEPPAGKEPTVEDLRRQAAGVGPNTVPQKPRQTQNESAMPKTLRDLGIDPYGSEADYTGAENLAMQTSSLKTMRRRMQSEIQKIAATAKERSFARQVAAGQLDMEDVPGTVDRNTVEILSDYYRALNGRSETQPLQNRRNKILEAEMAKMEPLLGMDVAYDERGLERRMIPGEGRLSKAANAARDSFAKTFSTFRRNLQTPARICEFEWGREHGAKVYKTLFQPVVENNGRQVAWMNNMLDGVREFADGSGNKRKLTKKERAVVQQLVENGASENRVLQLKTDADNARAKSEKAKKAVERARSVGINNAEAIQRAAVLADEAKIAENLWRVAENIQKGWAAEDAAREFGIDKSDQSFKDLENYSIYLKAKQELDNSADVDSRIVDTAVKAYSENYRKLYDAINTFLVGHGYDTIGFIQGYAPHLQPETQKTAFQKAMKMLGLNETAMDLPTSISGQTADLKPYKQYDPFFQTRNGSKTDFDIVRGFESYIQYLGNIFYHTDDIMRIRTAEKYLRKTYTNKEASEMISWAENARNFSAGEKLDFLKEYAGVEEDSALSYQDASKLLEDYISKLYDQVGSISRYGELAKYLNNYANRLAGKQSELDRGVEYSLGRGALNWINQMESKYGGAKIAFNVSSALNQTSQIPMVAVEAGEKNTFTAMLDFMNPSERGKKERADFISRSNFLKGKAGVDWISEPETRSEKIREKGFAMSEAVDGFTSYVAVRGKYLQAVNEGKSPVEAMQIADEYGRRVMGSRAKGEKPMLFDTKNPFWQIATKFQLEVMNTWDHVFHDMPNDIKNTAQTEGKVSAARKLAGRVVKYEAYAFLLNAGFRALYGGTPIPFDLLGNALEGIADAMGLTMGEAVKTLLDDVLEAVLDERVFGTDDDDKDDEIDVGKGISSFLGNAANDMPLVGRAAALLGIGDQTLPMTDFSKLGDLGTSIRKNGLISADTGEAALNVASEFAYGGNQLRKTGQGLLALGRGGSYSGDKLRYPVERTPENLVKGTLFGKSSFDSANEYYAHGSKTLTERMTRAYEGLVDNGVNREVAYDLIQQIRDQKDTPQKLEVITESLLTDREKLRLCYDVVAGKDDTWPDKLKKMMDAGLTWNEAEETYLEYLNLRD
ncbi:MAG: LPD23 domain-containing protein [Dysosmobacter sp.]|nr:LPD23 domain-containing protein [Dysosmobacter sp.]